jgi:hypothetical protein
MKHNVDQNKKTKKVSRVSSAKKPDVSTEAIKTELLVLGEWFNIHTMAYHPTTKKFVENEAVRLCEWAQLETSLLLQDFYNGRGYNQKTFFEWVNKFPELQAAHEFAMSCLGSRREIGAMTRKFEASTVHRTLGAYNHLWASETYKLSKMKEEIAAASENKIVVIERFPYLQADTIKETPEEVAGRIRKATGESRFVGSYDYNAKSRSEAE